jgi:hypothetical protein
MGKCLLLVFVICGLALAPGGDEDKRSAAERSIADRIGSRDFPSVFQAWSPADNVRNQGRLAVAARHDLAWHGVGWYGLQWDTRPWGLAEKFRPQSIKEALKRRGALLQLNPNMILIAEIRYRDAHPDFLPTDHRWWARDGEGNLVKGWDEGGFLCMDFADPEFRRHVARRAAAAVQSGVVDGIMLDWWVDDEHRLELVKEVRKAIGDQYLIIANTNDRTAPATAPYINGYFMECYRSSTPEHWRRIAATLRWAEANLRPPRVNCVETWYHRSRADLNLMRAVTTLTLTHSNGYCLFSDPNPLPGVDHRHNWYPLWDKSLGKPVSAVAARPDGAFMREFENGTVIYNPMGNRTATATFPEARISVATGRVSKTHHVDSPDGDILLKQKNK